MQAQQNTEKIEQEGLNIRGWRSDGMQVMNNIYEKANCFSSSNYITCFLVLEGK